MKNQKKSLRSSRLGRLARLGEAVFKGTTELAKDSFNKRVNNLMNKTQTAVSSVRTVKELVKAMGELKGGLMKLGQMISLTEDLFLPSEVTQELKSLQKDAPPMTHEECMQVFEQSFGKKPEEIFASFQQDPFAQASIGQVHLGQLSSGEKVAIKVQYPKIVNAIKNDFKNIDGLKKLLSTFFPTLPDIQGIIEEMKVSILNETDYRKELKTMEFFRTNLSAEFPQIVIPQSYPDFSTETVLTMQYLQGDSFDKSQLYSAEERNHLGQLIYDSFFYSLYHLKHIHADPQNGNYLFEPNKIKMLDFGSNKQFDEDFLELYVALLLTLEKNNFQVYQEVIQKLDILIPSDPPHIYQKHFQLLKDIYCPYTKEGIYGVTDLQPFTQVKTFLRHVDFKNRPSPRRELLLLDRSVFGLYLKLKQWDAKIDWVSKRNAYQEVYVHKALKKYF